jgi:hypothetical protein
MRYHAILLVAIAFLIFIFVIFLKNHKRYRSRSWAMQIILRIVNFFLISVFINLEKTMMEVWVVKKSNNDVNEGHYRRGN